MTAILLISTYDLGRQPFGLASPAAWLREAGHDVHCLDLTRVKLGQSAEVIPDAYPDAKYAAKVVKLYPQVNRQKGTLKIEVQVTNADARLLPDMSVPGYPYSESGEFIANAPTERHELLTATSFIAATT